MEPTKMTREEKRLTILKKKAVEVEQSSDRKRFHNAMKDLAKARIILKGKFYDNVNALEADTICETLDKIITAKGGSTQ